MYAKSSEILPRGRFTEGGEDRFVLLGDEDTFRSVAFEDGVEYRLRTAGDSPFIGTYWLPPPLCVVKCVLFICPVFGR